MIMPYWTGFKPKSKKPFGRMLREVTFALLAKRCTHGRPLKVEVLFILPLRYNGHAIVRSSGAFWD